MVHIVDLFPTFCRLGGARAEKKLPLDGVDIWRVLSDRAPAERTRIVHSPMVILQGDWKLIEEGATYYQWPKQPLQLYNIAEDPGEDNNLAAARPEIVERLRLELAQAGKEAREGEPVEPIPGYPVPVYGERENAKHGKKIHAQLTADGTIDRDVTIKR